MPGEHGKISREEFQRLTGEEPQRPQPPSRDELAAELDRLDPVDEGTLAALKKEMRDEMRRSWGS